MEESYRFGIQVTIENGTWERVTLPEGKNSVRSKWVFKVKRDERDIQRSIIQHF